MGTKDSITMELTGMESYRELRQKIDELERIAAQAREAELREVIADIHRKMDEYDITVEMIAPHARVEEKKHRTKAQPLYRDPVSGNEWSGRGRTPVWMPGKPNEVSEEALAPYRIQQ